MFRTILLAAASVLAFSSPTLAQDAAVNILQYALSHPSDNARMANPPQLGDSVPGSVQLHRAEGGPSAFAYFYYDGKPVIVDVKTRSVVKVGK